MEKSRLRKSAPTSVNVTVGRAQPRISDRAGGRAAHRGRQAEPLRASGRHGHPGCLPPRPQSLGGGGAALGRHRPHHRALACAQGQGRGCQRASDIGPGKSGAAQAPARSTNVTLRLHLGTSRTSFRSRISAHGGQGGRGREIHLSRSFPHAAARLRVQARQRRPRHSRHPSLSRPPLDHVHRYTALTPNRFKNFWKDQPSACIAPDHGGGGWSTDISPERPGQQPPLTRPESSPPTSPSCLKYCVSRELLPVFPNQAQRAQPLALQGVTAAKLLRAA